MPAILRETLYFPYTTGLVDSCSRPSCRAAGRRVDALYDRMPESTEQILHPEAYQARERPVAVDLPDDLAAQLGEPAGRCRSRTPSASSSSASGCARPALADRRPRHRGGRLGWRPARRRRGPERRLGRRHRDDLGHRPADATEFLDAAQPVDRWPVAARPGSRPRPGTAVTILIGSDEATLLALDVIFGATGV